MTALEGIIYCSAYQFSVIDKIYFSVSQVKIYVEVK